MPKVNTYYFLLKIYLRGSKAKIGQLSKRLCGVTLLFLFLLLPAYLLAQAEQVNPGGRFWKITGNNSINPPVIFLGTTDNIPFVFRTNNQQSGLINPLQSTTYFGYWSGINNNTGTQNAGLGINSLLFNTAGTQNTAAGTSVLENNTASLNTGIGYLALQSTTTGTNNIAIGNEALSNVTTGYNNVAIGRSAGFGVTDGHHNTFIGDSTTAIGANIFNSTAIGYGARVTASNNIILGRVGDGVDNYGVIIGHTRYNAHSTSALAKFQVTAQGNEENNVYRFASDGNEPFTTNYMASRGTLSSQTNLPWAPFYYAQFFARLNSTNPYMASFSCGLDTSIFGLTGSPLSGRLSFVPNFSSLTHINPTFVINRRGTFGIGVNYDYWDRVFIMSNVNMPYDTLGTGEFMVGALDSAGIPHTNLTFGWNEIFACTGTTPSTLYLQNEGGAYELHTVLAGSGNDFAVTADATVCVLIGAGIVPFYQLYVLTNSAAKPTSALWTVPSDEQLKKNVTPYTEGLDKIRKINPVWYNYNGIAGLPVGEKAVGTLAADVEQIAPHMIKPFVIKNESGSDTDYKSVDYNAMLFMCINAFKEQQARIDKLKEQNKWLKEQLLNRN